MKFKIHSNNVIPGCSALKKVTFTTVTYDNSSVFSGKVRKPCQSLKIIYSNEKIIDVKKGIEISDYVEKGELTAA
ncbi:MAG: hypothetical protein V5789_04545 [Colwellia sp.]